MNLAIYGLPFHIAVAISTAQPHSTSSFNCTNPARGVSEMVNISVNGPG